MDDKIEETVPADCLPSFLIPLHSDEGKLIFKEALSTRNVECYFKLAAQFKKQEDPTYGGLSTLVMVLNALEIDPGVVWKGSWRWFHENMLDASFSSREGTLEEFVCLAKCNSLKTTHVAEVSGYTIDEFSHLVCRYSQTDETFLIVKCGSWFSSVGGYHPGRKLVLLMDTGNVKYSPYLIDLQLLWNSMSAVDKHTGQTGGFATLTKE